MGIASDAKGFFKSDFNKLLFAALVILGIWALAFSSPAPQPPVSQNASFIHFFYLPTCPHCHAQMEELNPVLEQKYGINIIYHDVSSAEGGALFEKICSQKGLQKLVPTTLVGDKVFVGYSPELGLRIEAAVKECSEKGCSDPLTGQACAPQEQDFVFDLPFLGRVDVRSVSLPVLSVVLGFVDGFNPCAMWVLVYLIALLMEMNERRRIALIAGTFVLASAVFYFLLMSAWLNAFFLIGYVRSITILIGLVALGGGILMLKEFFETKGAMVCKVEGEEEKKSRMSWMKELASAPLTLVTLAGIVVLAVTVNSIEFVCSSAIPAVFTQVLSLSHLPAWAYYGYIALYDVFFMLDDLIVFGLAVFTLRGRIGEKYARYCRIIGGVLLFLLGIILLFAPQLLR